MNPTKCEVPSVMRFHHAKDERPVDIHNEIVYIYGNNIKRQDGTKWCRALYEGRTFMKNLEQVGDILMGPDLAHPATTNYYFT